MSNRTYAMIGTGAIGGFYGARLQRASAEVHFLLRGDFDHVAHHGLNIRSSEGDFVLPRVNAYAGAEDMPRCSVSAVALKATRNRLLPDLIPPTLGHEGVVLLLQNGFGEEERVAAIPGVREVIAGLCFICASKVGPGEIHHQDYGRVELARYAPDGSPGGITPVMESIRADLAGAGIAVTVEADLVLARWKKLLWNIPFSGLTVTMNANTAQVMADRAGSARAHTIMEELTLGAGALGRVVPREFADKMISDTIKMHPYFPSMKLDYDAGRDMELESMYGAALEHARAAGVEMPTVRALYEELLELDSARRRQQPEQ